MATTTNRDYPLAGINDAPDGPLLNQRLAEAVDVDVQGVVDGATRRLGRATAGGVLLGSSSVWEDLGTVTATTKGKTVQALWAANYANQNSGAHRVATFRILLDNVEVQRWTADAPFRTGETVWQSASFDYESSPLAGAHTWKLQALPSFANAVTVGSTTLRITEFQS